MDIYEELKAKKAQLEMQQQKEDEKKKNATLEAERFIPQIVKRIKDRAIIRVAKNIGPIYHRGLWGRTKYIKIEYKISQDDEGIDRKIYGLLYHANSSIYTKLAAAINAAGFCNTHVSYYEPRCYFYISTELNLP